MALSEDDVRGIADYARIALEGDELTDMTSYLNDAVDMLEIAFAAYQNGKTVPPALAAPLYVRDRVALTSEERRRGEKL